MSLSSPATIADGSVFAGRYHVVRCIARGGMGAIYEVIHLETQRRRALKVILPDVIASADLKERFRQEARVAAQIDSEHIVDVFDAGVDEPTKMPFLVMELLKGEELGDLLERVGKLAPADVVTYLHQTALALDKTHAANIVHRDLKPENLFLTRRDDGQPRIKVLDFGIAKVIADGATKSQATRSLGTPLYMAPEQFASGGRVFPATDIYSLGMMAYTLLVGEPYFFEDAERDGNIFAFAATVQAGPREAPSARAARKGVALPPSFDAWFARITSRDPRLRPAKATIAIAELSAALGTGDRLAAGVTGPQPAPDQGAYRASSPSFSNLPPQAPGAPAQAYGSPPQGPVPQAPFAPPRAPSVPPPAFGAPPPAAAAPVWPTVVDVQRTALVPPGGPAPRGFPVNTTSAPLSVPEPAPVLATPRKGNGLVVGLALVGVVLLAGAVGGFALLRKGADPDASSPVLAATGEPTGASPGITASAPEPPVTASATASSGAPVASGTVPQAPVAASVAVSNTASPSSRRAPGKPTAAPKSTTNIWDRP